MKNPFAPNPNNFVKPIENFDMGGIPHQKPPSLAGPKTLGVGLKGPWHLNPGNPDFPNHRPYLSNIKAPNAAAVVAPQRLKYS